MAAFRHASQGVTVRNFWLEERKQIHWKTRKLNVWYGIHVQEG